MIDVESIRNYCLKKKGNITEKFPFDEETLVLKIFGKMFLLMNIETLPLTINLKCNPERALELRERYDAVIPGYHMNKKLWNTVNIDGRLPERLVYELIDHSYDEVVKKLSKQLQKSIAR